MRMKLSTCGSVALVAMLANCAVAAPFETVVRGTCAGDVRIVCEDADGWKFDVKDAEGRFVPDAAVEVAFSVKGPGELVATAPSLACPSATCTVFAPDAHVTSPAAAKSSGGQTTIMTWNICHCAANFHDNSTIDPARTAEVIKKVAPDFVCLQEVDRKVKRSGTTCSRRDISTGKKKQVKGSE